MKSILKNFKKPELEFTDTRLTDSAGLAFLAIAARRHGLLRDLEGFERCKVRDRGASDQENIWALVACLASGRGTLSDLDSLKLDEAACEILGLENVSSSRRMGEWLQKIETRHVESLRSISTALARKLAPTIVKHEIKQRGYVPLFLDGTEIEVHGNQFEGAVQTYSEHKKYWMHAAFLGKVQLCGRLSPGSEDSVGDWRTHLAEDVVPAIPKGAPVWATADNAFYRGELVAELNSHGWDWSISVTNDNNKRPVLALIDEDAFWKPLPGNEYEETHEVCYKPAGWEKEARYVVVRHWDVVDGERSLFPRYIVIATSNHKVPMAKVVKRHRAKQGSENGFKGPLIEMDLHHPPTSKFHGNQLYYTCGLIAQQLLIATQFEMLPEDARSHGLRPLIRHVVRSVAKLTRSGGRHQLAFGKGNLKFDWLVKACHVHDAWWLLAPG